MEPGRELRCNYPKCNSAPFKTKDIMRRHRRGHNSETYVPCPICSKLFKRSDSMRSHKITHDRGMGSQGYTFPLVWDEGLTSSITETHNSPPAQGSPLPYTTVFGNLENRANLSHTNYTGPISPPIQINRLPSESDNQDYSSSATFWPQTPAPASTVTMPGRELSSGIDSTYGGPLIKNASFGDTSASDHKPSTSGSQGRVGQMKSMPASFRFKNTYGTGQPK